MVMNEIHPETDEALHFAESVRLLWEGTRQVVYGGIDTDDLGTLCSIVARVAERRLLRLQSAPQSSELESVIKQLQDSHDSALVLLAWIKTPTPEPNWSTVAHKLASVGAASLEFHK
jgi:hypothetical protein